MTAKLLIKNDTHALETEFSLNMIHHTKCDLEWYQFSLKDSGELRLGSKICGNMNVVLLRIPAGS